MAKPVILAVDDDISVLETVVQDLRRRYGASYRILRAGSGQAALDICIQLEKRADTVALFLSDQRMPGMSGVEFLSRAITHFPDAKRALLTAYADTEAAIRAINAAKIHYYLTKPWDPPEERLYPVLDDLLEELERGLYSAIRGPASGRRRGIRCGTIRCGSSSRAIMFHMSGSIRNRAGRRLDLLGKFDLDDRKLPVVLFPDGSSLVQPDQLQLATKIGLRTQATKEFYDLVIIGAGLAGLAAAVYGASEGLKTLVIESDAPGGQAGSSSKIENYLGFPRGVERRGPGPSGLHAGLKFGAEFLTQRAAGFARRATTSMCNWGGREVSCHVCLIAAGVSYRRLSTPGLDRLTGRRGLLRGGDHRSKGVQRRRGIHRWAGRTPRARRRCIFPEYAKQVTMLVRGVSLERPCRNT